jgi:hypothetical protein
MLRRHPLATAFAVAFAAWAGLAWQALAEPAGRATPAVETMVIGKVTYRASGRAAPEAEQLRVLERFLRSGPAVTVSGRRLPETGQAPAGL